nr:pyridoxamine kinase [uncultured Agathobaculum sp.]
MQKKVLALHDLSGFGRSSLVPIIAVISAGGHQCVPLPTAVFSTHTAIPGWVTTDLTGAMQGTIEQYDELELRFEAIYAGFLGSANQIDCVGEAARRLKRADGITLIDPVMGDNGKVYDTYTPEMCTRMRELCAIADIITPNTTEAAILLDRDPYSKPRSADEAWEWLRALRARYGAQVVLTGLDFEKGKVGSGCLSERDGALSLHRRIDRYYPGTGDLFASAMLAALLNGEPLTEACEQAGEYVKDCIAYTLEQQTDPMHGVQFEKLLYRLTDGSYRTENAKKQKHC